MSDSFAHRGVEDVLARVYALPTHVYEDVLAFRWLAIVERAVATMVISKADKNWARQSENITILIFALLNLLWISISGWHLASAAVAHVAFLVSWVML